MYVDDIPQSSFHKFPSFWILSGLNDTLCNKRSEIILVMYASHQNDLIKFHYIPLFWYTFAFESTQIDNNSVHVQIYEINKVKWLHDLQLLLANSALLINQFFASIYFISILWNHRKNFTLLIQLEIFLIFRQFFADIAKNLNFVASRIFLFQHKNKQEIIMKWKSKSEN